MSIKCKAVLSNLSVGESPCYRLVPQRASNSSARETSPPDMDRTHAPDNYPGVDEGHFGLLGVAERIETLNGTLDIRSAREQGTRIHITIPL